MTASDTGGPVDIRSLADELEIRNLVARLAHLGDSCGPDDLDEYVGLFTEDACWEMAGNQRVGRAEILKGARERRLIGQQGPGTNTRHVITTQAVRLEGPETAVSECCFLFMEHTLATPTVQNMGSYHDLLRREGGVWKVASRQIVVG